MPATVGTSLRFFARTPAIATSGSALAGRRGELLEPAMHEGDGHRALADRARDPLGRAARTSPAAKRPGTLVSSVSGSRSGAQRRGDARRRAGRGP